ncbi:MAG: hypothetical protein Kow00129_15880 [Thermoleophilia bacterium]
MSGMNKKNAPASRKKPKPVARINSKKCDRAPGCPVRRMCPKNAVIPDPSSAQAETSFFGLFGGSRNGWTIDEDKCAGCMLCAQYCPHGAVEVAARAV